MAEDQSVISNEIFDSTEATDDKCTDSEEMYTRILGAAKTPSPKPASFGQNLMFIEAWEHLRRSVVYYKGQAVGTIAALDHASGALDHASGALNYDQVFVRDFVPSASASLLKGEPETVKNFLLRTLHLQLSVKGIDRFALEQGLMSASFKFLHSFKVLHNPVRGVDPLIADFGQTAIGRDSRADSWFWWIILLHAYTRATGDHSLTHRLECQNGMKLILSVCLVEGFGTFPTLLCADGCCMADRRMGVSGHPIEIQALFFIALRCAVHLLREDDGKEFGMRIEKRLQALTYHMRSYFWLDFQQLNNIYRDKTEEYSHTAVNMFNVMPNSIPDWVFDFMPMKGGYFIANVSLARMDSRWFVLGNCVAILSSLATHNQSMAILDLIEERWEELVGKMTLKLSFPALDIHGWSIETGCDPKNTRWSYQNGGSWRGLLWLLTAACIKTGRLEIARKAIELTKQRLSKDGCCFQDVT